MERPYLLIRSLAPVIGLLFFCSCSSFVQNTAIKTSAGMMYKSTDEMINEKNWDIFKNGTPANLKMLEGLAYLQPHNEELLVSLSKGYAGLAFVVDETLALNEQLSGSDETFHKNQAILNYSKSLDYGFRYLKEKGISYADLQGQVNEQYGISLLLDQHLSSDMIDLEAVMFTGQSLGSLINLQKTNISLVAQLPIVKGLFDWVCNKRPDINFGACDIFYGAYEAGRPKALGGNPAKGQQIFLDAIKKYPENTLLRTSYIQFYLIPQGEEELYKEQMTFLAEAKGMFDKNLSWKPEDEKEKEVAHGHRGGFCIFKSLGLKRFEIIKKHEKKLF